MSCVVYILAARSLGRSSSRKRSCDNGTHRVTERASEAFDPERERDFNRTTMDEAGKGW